MQEEGAYPIRDNITSKEEYFNSSFIFKPANHCSLFLSTIKVALSEEAVSVVSESLGVLAIDRCEGSRMGVDVRSAIEDELEKHTTR